MDKSTSGKTILIVDDSPENIAILGDLLSGFNLKVATNGRKALNLLQTGTAIDLILLDVLMPELDGFAVARELKADPRFSAIPFIFITAQDAVQSFIEGFDLGAEEYIVKPFDSASVLRVVKNKLGVT